MTVPEPSMPGRSVWAPAARSLAIDDLDAPGGPRLLPMVRDSDGTWHSADTPAGRYWVVLDGERLPDPAAREQPDGFDGPSAGAAPATYAWNDTAWTGFDLHDSVLYELHVGTFSAEGTFAGVIDHLDELVELGVDAIELMPVHTFPGRRGWGYDGVLLGAPHHAYGGADGLRLLVDACHQRGLGVVLDVVYNHLGPLGNHLARFGPFFDEQRITPWGPAVNLDGPGSDGVRRFLVDDAVRWMRDHHLDGLRLDAVHAFEDRSAVHIVEEIAAAVHAVGDERGVPAWVIAESDLNDPRVVRPVDAGGWGADAVWSDDFHHALHAVLTGERARWFADFGSVAALARTLTDVFVHDGRYSSFRDRRHGRPVGDLDRRRFVGFVQNHDQVGNRPLGERLGHLAGVERACAAAALVLTAPFVPMLFQGEEWAASTPFLYFTDHPDAELGRLVREGRRAEFGHEVEPDAIPDPQAIDTFERSQLDWAEREQGRHAEVLGWYRSLLALRRAEPALRDGRPEATLARYDEAARWIAVARGPFEVIVNLADAPVAVPDADATERVLARGAGVAHAGGHWRLPGAAVLVARRPS